MRITATIIALCVIIASGLGTGVRADGKHIDLTRNGKSAYSIVVGKHAAPAEARAASELQRYLLEISGARLPIVAAGAADSLPRRMIVIGRDSTPRSVKANLYLDSLGDEGFAVKTAGPHLVIAGGGPRGTLYGVYTFLEDVLGCRWYTTFASKIPRRKSIRIGQLDFRQKPDFEYRDPLYTYSVDRETAKDIWDADWCVRQKRNGSYAWKLKSEHGGRTAFYPSAHTFRLLVPAETYFKEHPEYFALINGQRTGGDGEWQLCLTNPDVLRIVTDGVLRWIQERPDAKLFFVSQNDGIAHCQCDKCKAIDGEEGSPSGTLLRFVNAVADEIAKKHPDKLIATLAYQFTETPPKVTKPRPNVRVWLCPVYACQHHPYAKCGYPANVAFMERLRGWCSITDNLYIWHYVTNFQHYLYPLPNLDELAADIPMYKSMGVKGVFAQGTYTGGGGPAGGAGWMDELKAYLIAKLLWNTKTDVKAVKADFLKGYYGKAGNPIGEFLDLVHREVREKNVHANCFDGFYEPLTDSYPAFLPPGVMAKADLLFDQAEKLADSPEVLRRVKHAHLTLEYVRVHREVDRLGSQNTREQRSEVQLHLDKFLKKCQDDGILQLSEGAGDALENCHDMSHTPWLLRK